MNKKPPTNILKALTAKALQSQKIYFDYGGDAASVHILATLFKWPDATLSALDLRDDSDESYDQYIADISDIMLYPLRILAEAMLDRYNIKDPIRSRYMPTISAKIDNKNIEEILTQREMLIQTIKDIEEANDAKNRDSGDNKQENFHTR
jgi:hypothetical protein